MRALQITMMLGVVCLTAIGCSYIGGGIAGASFDPIWQRNAAEQYPETIATNRVTVNITPRTGERPPQLFDDIMHDFPVSQERIQASFVPIASTGIEARYGKHRLEIRNGNTVLISEKLPKVFNMHPVRLGMGTVAAQSVIMVVNKSRSSTGLYFVALYTAEGKPLYKCVLGAGQVWDIRLVDNGIDILGHSETRHISMTKEAEPEN